MTRAVLDAYIFLIGLCIGSFLNVCIYRLPMRRSIVHPGSSCPNCQTPIRWYDNLPVLSYIALHGRCRSCGSSISLRYPLVELVTGLFALAVWLHSGAQPQTLVYFVFIAALLVITFVDLDHRIIPDAITLPGIPIGFGLSFFLPSLSWLESILGILLGGGSLFALAWGYQHLTGREGMGYGDVKLLAMIGAFIGWQGVLFTILLSSLTGTTAGVVLMLAKRKGGMKMAIPFGPFLAIGALLYLFFGPQWIEWYFQRVLL